MSEVLDGYKPSPVRNIKPPKTTQPADTKTIATILLRKNKALYDRPGSNEGKRYLGSMLYQSARRELTAEEATKTLALLTELRET